MCCSVVVTGNVRGLTGGVRIGFWGLDKLLRASIKGLTGPIGSFGTLDHVRR
jgi:hypothetical protein